MVIDKLFRVIMVEMDRNDACATTASTEFSRPLCLCSGKKRTMVEAECEIERKGRGQGANSII